MRRSSKALVSHARMDSQPELILQHVQVGSLLFNAVDRFESFHRFIHREKTGENHDALFGPPVPARIRSKHNRNRDGLPFWQLFSGCDSGQASIPAHGYLRSFGSPDGVGIVAQPLQNLSTAPYQLVYFIHLLGHSLGMYHETLCPEAHVPCRNVPPGAPSPVGNTSVSFMRSDVLGITHIDGRLQFAAYGRHEICETVRFSKCTWLASGMARVTPSKKCPAECGAQFCSAGVPSDDFGQNLSRGKCVSFCGYRYGNSNSESGDADKGAAARNEGVGIRNGALRSCGEGESYQTGDFVDCTMCGPVDPDVRLCENQCNQLCKRDHCRSGNATFGGVPLVNGWCTSVCSSPRDPLLANSGTLVEPQTCGNTTAYQAGMYQICDGCERNLVDRSTRTESGGYCKLPFSYEGREYTSCKRGHLSSSSSSSSSSVSHSSLSWLSSLTRGQAGGAAPVSLRAVTVALAQPRSSCCSRLRARCGASIGVPIDHSWSTPRVPLEYLRAYPRLIDPTCA